MVKFEPRIFTLQNVEVNHVKKESEDEGGKRGEKESRCAVGGFPHTCQLLVWGDRDRK